MSSYLKQLREQRNKSIETLTKQIDDSKKTSYGDDRFWKLSVDKTGNGEAVIRFLPPFYGENVAWVDKYSHTFEGSSGKWFIENCPTTTPGNQCPVCDANRVIWKNNPKEIAQKKTEKTKRVHKYYSNILVVDDPANPENNGKVFLFEFGPKLFAKIEEAIKPISTRQKAIDPFDIDEGANFLLLAKNVAGQRNYDSSRFEGTSSISEEDKEIERILNSLYSLQALVSKDNFKTYEELSDIYSRVQGRNGTVISHETEVEDEVPEENYTETSSIKKGSKVQDIDIDLDELPF